MSTPSMRELFERMQELTAAIEKNRALILAAEAERERVASEMEVTFRPRGKKAQAAARASLAIPDEAPE